MADDPGVFKINPAKRGLLKRSQRFYFNLHAPGNHEIIATSEIYETKQACEEGINVVRRIAPGAVVEDTTIG